MYRFGLRHNRYQRSTALDTPHRHNSDPLRNRTGFHRHHRQQHQPGCYRRLDSLLNHCIDCLYMSVTAGNDRLLCSIFDWGNPRRECHHNRCQVHRMSRLWARRKLHRRPIARCLNRMSGCRWLYNHSRIVQSSLYPGLALHRHYRHSHRQTHCSAQLHWCRPTTCQPDRSQRHTHSRISVVHRLHIHLQTSRPGPNCLCFLGLLRVASDARFARFHLAHRGRQYVYWGPRVGLSLSEN